MDELDKLVKERLVPFRERMVEMFRSKHPHIVTVFQAFLDGKRNRVGLRVTNNGQTAGEYTFHLEGIRIVNTEGGRLDSEVNHPFLGIIKPYAVIEKAALERLIADETDFEKNFFPTMAKHLPDLTVKFMS